MRKSRWMRVWPILPGLLFLPVAVSEAQLPSLMSPRTFELSGGLGVSNTGTVVSGGSAEGEQFYATAIAARYFFPSAARFSVGGELGGTRHSYQSFNMFGPTVDNESYTVLHAGVVGRMMLGLNSQVDLGANLYRLPATTDLGFTLGLSRRFNRSFDRYVPIGIHSTVLFDADFDTPLLVFVATIGYGWRR